MNIDTQNFGPVIRKIRIHKGMTQKELADKSSLTINYLSLLENGKRGIGMDKLNIIAGVFGIPSLFIVCLSSKADKAWDKNISKLFLQIQKITEQVMSYYLQAEE